MEREAVFQFRQFAAIEVIAADRAADMRQMHANLMGAPGLQPQADERAASGGLLDAVMRHGAPTVGANRAFCARAEAGNRRVDHALAPRGNALGHGEVFADEAVRVKLAGQQALGVGMAGDAQQAARALVQPIDGVIIKRRRVLPEQGGELLAERPGVDMAAGERGQRRALADDEHILVDIADEGRRQAVGRGFDFGFGFDFGCGFGFAVVHADFQPLPRAQNRVRAQRRAVAEDTALDLEPTKGVCAKLKPAGDDAPRRAPRVLLGGDIG